MSRSISMIAATGMLLLTGAGCFGIGGGSTPAAATGGVWMSEDSGRTWTPKSVYPTATGTSSINGLDLLTIEQDPSDASALYIGSRTSGMFYTLDGGESWLRPENTVAASGAIVGIEVDPRNVCTHYILKADRLLKTTTCGREYDTEVYVETRTEERLTALAIDWYNPNTIYLGTTEGDLLRSLDAGNTWSALTRVNDTIVDIEVSNADSRIVFLGTRRRGLQRSVDGGATWTSFEEALEDFSKSDNVYDLAQSPDGSRLLMSSEFGILTSTDSGATWSKVPLVTDSGEVTVRAISVSATNSDTIYYGTANTFFVSTSAGNAWSTSKLPTTRATSFIHSDPSTAGKVYLGTITLED